MKTTTSSIWSAPLLRAAAVGGLRKLTPGVQWKNPVMFVVWVGAVLLTVSLPFAFSGFNLQIVLWLWLTLWFANFAEAIAEGRGRAEAAALQSTQSNLRARALKDDNEETTVDASTLKKGDRFVCEAGDTIPADGEIIEGIDSVNNDGPRGFTEILYEFSAAANNGSGYEGLGDDTVAWNLATGLVMLLGRFIPIILPLAIAGSLAAKKPVAESAGTLRPTRPPSGSWSSPPSPSSAR